ncbi:hypothetical protein LVB77_12590 [Lysobacter sp. 5GHs7-4]|uniref:hypothetical protein n=1 Tax=Lysobacter sp. 5GHs7-4 TaxID=2904253 RepID=UPI001E5FB235|nr:hypothetical protein [Lysobacter sp. 5GHs7-4]UHQ21520.1 hypothetical protein LVB77_12590 [Lysobacter sp. 5GHs7-4]
MTIKAVVFDVYGTFGPGVVDSTHCFQVSYSSEGQVVGAWSVNTRTGQVAGAGESLWVE